MSARWSGSWPRTCSGARYCGMGSLHPGVASPSCPAWRPVMPNSDRYAWPPLTRMLAGFSTLYVRPCWWAASRVSATWLRIVHADSGSRPSPPIRSRSVGAVISGIAAAVMSSDRIGLEIGRMCGWPPLSRIAASRRRRSARSSAPCARVPTSFSAHHSPDGVHARYTAVWSPCPRQSSSTYLPTLVPSRPRTASRRDGLCGMTRASAYRTGELVRCSARPRQPALAGHVLLSPKNVVDADRDQAPRTIPASAAVTVQGKRGRAPPSRIPPLSGTFGAPAHPTKSAPHHRDFVGTPDAAQPSGLNPTLGDLAKTDSSKDDAVVEFFLPPRACGNVVNPQGCPSGPKGRDISTGPRPAAARVSARPRAWTFAARSRFDGRARSDRGVALPVDSEEGACGAEPRVCDCHPWPGHG